MYTAMHEATTKSIEGNTAIPEERSGEPQDTDVEEDQCEV
jgi:hypothetical protein